MPGVTKTTFRRIASVVKFAERSPRRDAPGAYGKQIREDRWFVNTGPITTAIQAGADLNTWTLTLGSGQARICIWDGGKYVPDTSKNAKDQTIYNPTVISASIPAGNFFKCTIVNGMWEIDLSSNC